MPPMHTIDLAYLGRGVHEELVAYVADQEDISRMKASTSPSATASGGRPTPAGRRNIGLGRTLLSRLTDGIQWKMLAVNTHRPLFWFLGRGKVKSMDDLRGAGWHPPTAHRTPLFARIVLRKHGLDPDRDLECVVIPGDYQMDLRAFAKVRSMRPTWAAPWPRTGRPRGGLSVLAWVGDHFQIPTVGIAVDPLVSRLTTRRCRRWCGPTSEPFARSPNDPVGGRLHRPVPQPADP